MGVNMANLKIKGAPDNGTGACVLTVLAVLLSRFLVEVLCKLFQGVKELTCDQLAFMMWPLTPETGFDSPWGHFKSFSIR